MLADICSEDWVREKFLHDPEELLKREQLLDPLLKPQEVNEYLVIDKPHLVLPAQYHSHYYDTMSRLL